MFGPLVFPEPKQEQEKKLGYFDDTEQDIYCVFCENVFKFPKDKETCLKHLFDDHKFVIGDVDQVANLTKTTFFINEEPLSQYCTIMIAKVKKGDETPKDEKFSFLSDIDSTDKNLRSRLQMEKLEIALDQQKVEREDKNFKRGCLICRDVIESSRADYITHLFEQHNLNLGKPYNLVFIDKFISTLESKMENLQCIFCEKIFKDRNVMKEHMRKKGHKRINPDLKFYDQFYLSTYIDSNNKKEKKKRDESPDGEDPNDWSDWGEEIRQNLVCLFCNLSYPEWDELAKHMQLSHHFDYELNTKEFDFYKQVKLVNYIRRQVYKNKCIKCETELENSELLLQHMEKENHFSIPKSDLWDQPEYYFPTYENDSFLCQLDDKIN